MNRTIPRRLIRAVILIVIGIGSITFPEGSVLFWSLCGAFLATDGPWRSFISLLILAIFVELLGGFGIGARSIPFAVTALITAGAGRFISVGPWAIPDGWHLAPWVRTWCVAVVAGMIMAMMAGVMVSLFQGYPLKTILMSVIDPPTIFAIGIGAGVILPVLRRIDVPFRTRIQYGT